MGGKKRTYIWLYDISGAWIVREVGGVILIQVTWLPTSNLCAYMCRRRTRVLLYHGSHSGLFLVYDIYVDPVHIFTVNLQK